MVERRQLLCGALLVAATAAADVGPGAASAGAVEDVGSAVVALAQRQIGVPYAWGGGDRLGPGIGYCEDDNGYLDGVCQGESTIGFDCSGLTLYCWYAASRGAVQLGHYTVAQYRKGTPVPRAELRAGDLLFFSRPDAPLHHVGIHAGGGAMIHAAHTGTLVARLENAFADPLWGPQFAGAVRPTG
ncbi:cell wall-associated NlpC family hydrolase [Kitasatospora sp. MAA4]|uniref:C40 family peptidase n=1 Tax=Kitasatospora sp. MAA4 TaxID=3035093 RepID=UPI002475F15A|nr:C40 family peptidase [Kitasatospora sp. MAA4]MDH6131980.1 cell wall-associated NlpC family hydrolase [Kitasatospora sp. MAA4]